LAFSFLKIAFCPAGRRNAAQGRRQAPGSTLVRRATGWHPPVAVLLAMLLSGLVAGLLICLL
jgi:RsiW-degrading membrane proteinase PrsW (M82 family)